MTLKPSFSPAASSRARGREWIVLAGSDARDPAPAPVSGSEEEPGPHLPAARGRAGDAGHLPAARPSAQRGGQDAALLLRDALLLSLRRGAGPFRSFGQIAVEPRAYQLVPLLMALKLDPVRLLIADDVGIGKTIEAALIARELLDRGEIERLAVLCPPHLVEQWAAELEERFHIRRGGRHRRERRAASSAACRRASRIFDAYPFTVVSLDYIKSERRRDEFLRACPDFVIVDEAHTCAAQRPGPPPALRAAEGARRRRRRATWCCSPPRRTAATRTPSTPARPARPDVRARCKDLPAPSATRLRERLARHFVQRRRPDIAEWQDGNALPRARDQGAHLQAHRRLGAASSTRCSTTAPRAGRGAPSGDERASSA